MAAKLKLVPFSPNDFSTSGAVLGEKSGALLEDPDAISSALSLYFQWRDSEDGAVGAFILESVDGRGLHCQLEYDRDERVPSELWIQDVALSDFRQPLEEFQSLVFRFEVFLVCYEFSATVLALEPLVISIPKSLRVYKSRRLPRLELTPMALAERPPCSLQWAENSRGLFVAVEEMGVRSLKVHSDQDLPVFHSCWVDFSGLRIQAKVQIRRGTSLVLVLEFQDSREYGRYFDLYKTVAYPALRSKSQYPASVGLQLYNDTGYFGKFSRPEEAQARSEEIQKVWESLMGVQHLSTADYYVVDEQDKVTGASSVVHGFKHRGVAIWVFHQLCTMTDPAQMDATGQLYLWRAEYLAGRQENLDTIGWFDSKSRWLERIYVKFSKTLKAEEDSMTAVQVNRVSFHGEKAERSDDVGVMEVGGFERKILDRGEIFGGLEPRYLNASATLDSLICLGTSPTEAELQDAAMALLSAGNQKEAVVEVTTRADQPFPVSNLPSTRVTDVDRYFRIKKEDLSHFMASVSHSIAVTKRKQRA